MISGEVVRHGYTLADIDDCARIAVAGAATRAADYRDRHDAAWHAIAEHLLEVAEQPTRNDLIRAGRRAVHKEVADHMRHHGIPSGADAGVVRRSFAMYWETVAEPTSSPETVTVERLALVKIWPHLMPGERRALRALAASGTYATAAEALGVAYPTVSGALASGRRRFLALWHEGEMPHVSAYSRNRKRTDLKTHCPSGHGYTVDNTRVYPRIVGGRRWTVRICKTCERIRGQGRSRHAKGALLPARSSTA